MAVRAASQECLNYRLCNTWAGALNLSTMLKIRLTRLGAKKAPFYRIVVADARAPREGRPVDTIGQYDATKQPAIVNVDEEKALAWLAKGAQPTDTVRSLFKKQGVMQKFADAKK